jgi:hypothetical protein
MSDYPPNECEKCGKPAWYILDLSIFASKWERTDDRAKERGIKAEWCTSQGDDLANYSIIELCEDCYQKIQNKLEHILDDLLKPPKQYNFIGQIAEKIKQEKL